MNEEIARIRSLSGLSNLVEGSYSAKMSEKNYEVTPEEAASHMHMLDTLVPLKTKLDDAIREIKSYGMINNDELIQLQDASNILRSIMIPQALLKVQAPKPSPFKLR